MDLRCRTGCTSTSDRDLRGTPPLNVNGFIDLKVTPATARGRWHLHPDHRAGQRRAGGCVDRRPDRGGGYALVLPGPGRAFSDVDSTTLTYTATLANGSALPPWLTFDALPAPSRAHRREFDRAFDLKVAASDGSFTASDTFRLTVTAVNDAPVATPIADQTMAEDTAWSFQVPAERVRRRRQQPDLLGEPLGRLGAAGWLAFDAATRTFSGTPPQTSTVRSTSR